MWEGRSPAGTCLFVGASAIRLPASPRSSDPPACECDAAGIYAEDGWDECEEREGLRNFDEMVDVIAGFLIGLIVAAIGYLILF
jgi:hypothetical protein